MSFASCSDLTALESQLLAQIQAMTVLQATEALQGKVELATQLETAQGTDRTRAVTPYGLKYALNEALAAAMTSINITNLVEAGIGSDPGAQAAIAQAIADDIAAEIAADDALMSVLIAAIPQATETEMGLIEIADLGETALGIDDTRAVTPYKLFETLNDNSVACGNQLQRAVTHALGRAIACDSATQLLIADATKDDMALALAGDTNAMATIAAAIPDATTTVKGKAELATNTEALAGTSTTVVLTPANLAAVLSSMVDAFGS